MTRTASRVLLGVVMLMVGFAVGEQGGKYLIIAADNYVGIVQPLADWKTKKGVPAKVVPVSQVGANPSSIQAYIRNAYSTWPVPPEFVLLAGDPSHIPPYTSTSDCPYGDMGGDYRMELPVGRFPATTARECTTMVRKTLSYERPSWVGDTTWYMKATTCVREDANDTFYWSDSRVAHSHWRDRDYLLIDSFSSNRGNNSGQVNAAGTEGRAFLTFRGQGVGAWWSPFNTISPASWNNGNRLPVVIAGTCATVTLQGGESMYGDQFVRAGTPDALGGTICYFGTTMSLSGGAHFRSAVYRGFFNALYGEKERRLGIATLRGRFRVDSLYHVQSRYTEWNLLGDPELNVWTGMPRGIEVQYDSVIPLAPQTLNLMVRSGGAPVSGAVVCAWMDSVVYATGVTSGAGQVGIDINPTHVGPMYVTVTGSNLRPFEGTARVMVSNAPYIVAASTSIDDYIGNHDQTINPGERCRLTVGLRNLGGATATGVTARLRVSTPGVTVSDSTSSYGVIMPDSLVAGDPLDIAVDSTLVEGQPIVAWLRVLDSQADTWICPLNLVVRAGRIGFTAAYLTDSAPGGNGNSRLGRGESGRIRLAIQNNGGAPLHGIIAAVRCLDTNVVVTDSLASYGTAVAGQQLSGSADRFGVTAGPGLVRNQPVRFFTRILSDGGTYRHTDTFSFEIPAEQGFTNEPTGPDAYGYWCYDDTDTTSGRAPVYNWFEIAPPGPGTVIPAVSDSDAVTVTLPMPFPFRFYGRQDNFMSICSNGFLALGYTTYNRGANRAIPDTAGPPLMIAPFWDDLNPDESRNGYGTAYQYYDTAGHRWIVEFKDFAHYNQPSIRETFQAIFYDPAWHHTPTGDGEIVFLYNRVSLNSGCTIGIEDETETRGIQYLYNNNYSQTASYIQAGRALKFTTWPPTGTSRPWLVLSSVQVSDSLHGNNNGLLEPGETLTVAVTVRNSGSGAATNVAAMLRPVDSEGTMLDSFTALPDIAVGGQAGNPANPFVYRVATLPADSVVEMALALTADEYMTACYFSFGLVSVQSVETQGEPVVFSTGLERVRPNPVRDAGTVAFSLARPASVDLALFDASGRRAATLAAGQRGPGRYSAALNTTDMAQGIYFCRLTVQDAFGVKRFIRKVQVVR